MDAKLAKKHDFQAYIDTLLEECNFDYCENKEEAECHLNVDLILSKIFYTKEKMQKVSKESKQNDLLNHHGHGFIPQHVNNIEKNKKPDQKLTNLFYSFLG